MTRGFGKSWGPQASYALFVAAALTIFVVQPSLAAHYAASRATSDAYALPPPEQAALMSLGYRAAFADFIYAHLRVAHGLHFEEKRRFEYVGQYLDVITYLDPKFTEPYLFADTFLTVQPVPPRQEDYDKAKELLLRGTQELPYNQEVWFVAGQFIAYVAPPHLKDAAKREAWRLQGAKLLGRACELASSNVHIPHHCISAATLLNRAGEREALIQMLTRTLAVTDDPEIRARALSALQAWVGEEERVAQERRLQAFQKAWAADLRFVPKARLLLMGPRLDPLRCVGVSAAVEPDCALSWRDWSAQRNFAGLQAAGP